MRFRYVRQHEWVNQEANTEGESKMGKWTCAACHHEYEGDSRVCPRCRACNFEPEHNLEQCAGWHWASPRYAWRTPPAPRAADSVLQAVTEVIDEHLGVVVSIDLLKEMEKAITQRTGMNTRIMQSGPGAVTVELWAAFTVQATAIVKPVQP